MVGPGDREVRVTRKVGDKWTDSDGYEWEQRAGYKLKKASVGEYLRFQTLKNL